MRALALSVLTALVLVPAAAPHPRAKGYARGFQSKVLSVRPELAGLAVSVVGGEDVWSRALTLSALGLVRSAQGRTDEARSLLRQAVGIAEPTGYSGLARRVRDRLEAFERERATAPAQT